MAQNKNELTAIAVAKNTETTTTTTPASQTNLGFFESIRNWWDALTDPEKVRATATPRHQLQEARDQMVCAIAGILGLILFRKMFPTLFVLTGVMEMLAMFFSGQMIFEAVRFDRNLSEELRRAERAAGRTIRSYLLWVVILTVLAGWIATGPAWAEQFPILKELANYQLGMVNELIEWAQELLGKWF